MRSVFGISDIDREIIEDEIRRNNFKRAVYILVSSIAINIFLISLFQFNLGYGSSIEIKWRESIISLHMVLLCINLLLGAFALYINYKQEEFRNASKALLLAMFLILPIWGAIAVTLDQWVTTSIMSFFLVCAACSVGLLVRPVFSFLLFAFAYIIYYAGISVTQTNADVLLSNKVNGFYAVAICFGLSVIFWRHYMRHYRQTRQIQLQKQELEDNYNSLLQSTEQLSAANATKDKFFSIIAHDLRGPINSTVSLSELLIDGSQIDSPEERSQMLKMLHDSLTSTNKLLSNLLIWAQAQTSDIGLQKVKTSLRDHAQENIDLLYSLASVKNIALNNCITDDVFVYADPEMLNTIFRNLISNAIKFTNANGVINLKIEDREIAGNQQFIEVCVKDNGIGMNAIKIESLFRKDKIISTTGTNHETGTGFGL
ncbi:MAG: sensor histidine kinase, partial [Bacteroidia bacterium]